MPDDARPSLTRPTPMARPLVVIESSNPAAAAHRREALNAARADGWAPWDGWAPPRGRFVCEGQVSTEADAVGAVRAALAGAAIVAIAGGSREMIDRLVDDLRRLGPVDHRTSDIPAPIALDADQLGILRFLADGWTLGDAAEELGLSRRTADRRLAQAKRLLGSERTAEALTRAKRLGLLK